MRQLLKHPLIEVLLQEVISNPAQFDDCSREYSPAVWPSWRLLKLLQGSFAVHAGLWRADADVSLRAVGESAVEGFHRVTPAACRILLVVAERFEAFIAPLRAGTAIAHGHLANGDLVRLSAGIWCSSDFWIDITAGSVGDFQDGGEDDPDFRFIPRWHAIALAELSQDLASKSPLREKAAQTRVATAVEALWPDQARMGRLSAKVRNGRISDWLKNAKMEAVSSASIRRYFQYRREMLG